jgi:thioredoxin-related protein
MNRNHLNKIATLILFFFLAVPVSVMATNSIAWYGYDKGLSLAKEKKKKVYINFHADWCGYCRKMEKETFVDPKVIAFLNDNFIAVRLNSDKEPKLAQKFNVRGLPANFFLTDQGEPIGNQPGYLDVKNFLNILNFVKDEKYKKPAK